MPLENGIEAARKWKKLHVNPRPRKGGRLPGAGRKRKSEPASERASEPGAGGGGDDKDPVDLEFIDRGERLRRLSRGETLTRAQIDLTFEETKLLDTVRESQEANGKLFDAGETIAAWGELLQAHKGDCDGMPQRVEAKAGAKLRLSPEQGRVLRGIVEEEIGELFKRLMAAEWMKKS